MTQQDKRPTTPPETSGADETATLPTRHPRALMAFGLVLITLWVAVAAFVFHTNQEENVLTSSWQKSVKSSVQTLLPEQWGFFTRSPREEELLPFSLASNGTWTSSSLYPHSRADHAFGWNRESRAQGIEIGIVYAGVADVEWTQCGPAEDSFECLAAASSPTDTRWLTAYNPSPDPTICGRSALSKALPPPWAWANIGQPYQEVSVVLVDVKC